MFNKCNKVIYFLLLMCKCGYKYTIGGASLFEGTKPRASLNTILLVDRRNFAHLGLHNPCLILVSNVGENSWQTVVSDSDHQLLSLVSCINILVSISINFCITEKVHIVIAYYFNLHKYKIYSLSLCNCVLFIL